MKKSVMLSLGNLSHRLASILLLSNIIYLGNSEYDRGSEEQIDGTWSEEPYHSRGTDLEDGNNRYLSKHDLGSTKFHEHEDGYKNYHQDQKQSHLDQADHSESQRKGEIGHNAAKFVKKGGHKKGHKTKGYHNRFHKDEYLKEHKFYDNYHKRGDHTRHGNSEGAHGIREGQKKNTGHNEPLFRYIHLGEYGDFNQSSYRRQNGDHEDRANHSHNEDYKQQQHRRGRYGFRGN